MLRVIIAIFVLTGCSSVLPPSPGMSQISKARWAECWALCGKQDNLLAVSEKECLCRGGYKVIQNQPEPVQPIASGGLMEKILTPFEFLIPE